MAGVISLEAGPTRRDDDGLLDREAAAVVVTLIAVNGIGDGGCAVTQNENKTEDQRATGTVGHGAAPVWR